MDYNIYAGLGGSFGGAQYVGTIRNATAEEALEYAYDIAVEKYEDYTFYDGVHSYSEVEEKMKSDWYLSAEKCVEKKVYDGIITSIYDLI